MNTSLINEKILELKFKLDSSHYPLSRIDKLVMFCPHLMKDIPSEWTQSISHKKVVNGRIFIRAVLPFCSFGEGDSTVSFVPAKNVMAGSYRGLTFPTNPQRLCDELDSYAGTVHSEAANYDKVSPFNVYVAGEGKNRVDLYRNINRLIRATITQRDYPKPHELELLRFAPFGVTGLRYLGSDPHVARRIAEWQFFKTIRMGPIAILGFKESVDILKIYGVKFGRQFFAFRTGMLSAKIRLRVSNSFYVS